MEGFPGASAGQGRVVRYQPLVVILAAVAAGTVADRLAAPPLVLGWVAAVVGLGVWLWLWRQGWDRLAAGVLLMAVAAAAGAWHHCRWSLFLDDELGWAAREEAEPVCVEAVALGSPRWSPAGPPNPLSTIPASERMRVELSVAAVRDGRHWRPASGRTTLMVNGHLLNVRAGDRLRIFAQLRAPARPLNPGEFDFARYQRGRRHLCQLHTAHPDCVQVIQGGSRWRLGRAIQALRDRGNRLLWDHLRHERAGLAAAVLLGAREQLDQERTDAFFTTGTIHLLAISGLHVGIMAYGFWLVARLGLLSRRATLVLAALLVILYALLTDARPPVVRATILVLVMCAARYWGRQALAFNTLAAAGLVVWLVNPAHLFQTGAQLSFLAVGTLSCSGPWLMRRPPADPLDKLVARTRPWPLQVVRRVGSGLWRLWLATTLIWLVALPLVLYRFHLVSPAALVLNPILWLPTAAALFSGFGVLAFGWLLPPLAGACGWVCDVSLTAIEWCIDVAQQVPGNHFWSCAPGLWWLLVFYGSLATLAAFPRLRPARRWCLALLAAWIAVGLWTSPAGLSRLSRAHGQLDCTFVAVGHGTCVVVELPQGQTLMYDAGSLGSPDSGMRSIAGLLWARGITHLDAVVLSHGDADHYNALPGLLKRFSVGVVYVWPEMFDRPSPGLQALHGAILQSGVPVQPLFTGERLQTDPVQIEVLHPPETGVGGSENANSIVLQIDYAGRRILLPGDVEPPGLELLLSEPGRPCHIVMAPHHGSAHSDPPAFAAWSTPQWLVISAASGRDVSAAQTAYAAVGSQIVHTAQNGAARVTIHPDGQFHVQTWRENPW